MFRFAKCKDLIDLKLKHRDKWSIKYDMYLIKTMDKKFKYVEEVFQWNLKEMGRLFCTDNIVKPRRKKILEVGAGYNLYFDRIFGKNHEVWMVDNANYYNEKVFRRALKKRKRTRHVIDLMGNFSNELPNEYFDIIVSVSVLEHVPQDNLENCYKDMFRVLKPNGIIAHSIDIDFSETESLPKNHYEAIQNAGFKFDNKMDIEWVLGPSTDEKTLLQPLVNVFGFWRLNWKVPIGKETPITTILCRATK
jgi:2-polyprenyl-3-methyl-5-hydroxy-6-metoxy-1,4-benzoquinol methylase